MYFFKCILLFFSRQIYLFFLNDEVHYCDFHLRSPKPGSWKKYIFANKLKRKMTKLDITITGDLGSGKSSVAKVLCKMLNFNYFSTGSIQRQIGKENGMNTLELNYFSEENTDIDKFIDDKVIKLNDDPDSFILDSRMAWHFIRRSFKIYLTVDPIVAAQRVIADNQREGEPVIEDANEKSLNLLERRAAEDKRFKTIYGVDCGDLTNYDLVLDTTFLSVQEVSKLIVERYNEFLNSVQENCD
jgi:cytidylate kinase